MAGATSTSSTPKRKRKKEWYSGFRAFAAASVRNSSSQTRSPGVDPPTKARSILSCVCWRLFASPLRHRKYRGCLEGRRPASVASVQTVLRYVSLNGGTGLSIDLCQRHRARDLPRDLVSEGRTDHHSSLDNVCVSPVHGRGGGVVEVAASRQTV